MNVIRMNLLLPAAFAEVPTRNRGAQRIFGWFVSRNVKEFRESQKLRYLLG